MYFRYRPGGIFSNIPTATKNILLVNIFMMILTAIRGDWMYEQFALFYPSSPFFKIWQPITHLFMHGGFWHLFLNMYMLVMFGSVLERIWGTKKFLLFYFVTGLGAAALHLAVMGGEVAYYTSLLSEGGTSAYQSIRVIMGTPSVGASGALYGLLLGYAMLYPDARMTLLFPPVTMDAKMMVIVFTVIELVTGIFSIGGGIAHFAHLGGMLFGYLIILYWKKRHTLYDNWD